MPITHLTALPPEVLNQIFTYLQFDYTVANDPAIFDAMRVSRLFFNLAFSAHMNPNQDYRISAEEEERRGKKWTFDEKIELMLWDERWARKWVRGREEDLRDSNAINVKECFYLGTYSSVMDWMEACSRLPSTSTFGTVSSLS